MTCELDCFKLICIVIFLFLTDVVPSVTEPEIVRDVVVLEPPSPTKTSNELNDVTLEDLTLEETNGKWETNSS